MSTAYAKHFSTRETPQSEAIPGKSMTPNSAGGFGFEVDDFVRLDRFLILGNPGGSYYASEKKLTVENGQCVLRCLDIDPERTIRTIVEVSDSGRAPKNDPAVFALALATGHNKGKAYVFANDAEALRKTCHTGTHLFQFVEAAKSFRGFGKGLRKAISAWYEQKTSEWLAYQIGKYQSRNGWSHRDLLRLSHPNIKDGHTPRSAVLRWAVGGKDALQSRVVKRGNAVDAPSEAQLCVAESLPPFLAAVDEAKTANKARLVQLIAEHDLPRECVPTERLNDPEVWEALLVNMPLTALVRNLAKMTNVGLLKPMSEAAKSVADKLADQDHIRKSRLHPMVILLAARTYSQGHGDKGKLTWDSVSQINDALDAAFYLAFGNVEPTGKRTLMGLDVSGSMTGATIAGTSLSCAEAAAAMAMVQMKTEPRYQLMAFDTGMRPLDISRYSRLSDVLKNTSNINGGGTDCSLPMVMGLQLGWEIDTFQCWTDNETWVGRVHPSQALVAYRQKTGIAAKLAVVGMTATEISIADPSDAGMLDFCGLDASLPGVLADFSRG